MGAGFQRIQNRYQTIPAPQGATAEMQSSVYHGFYGEMPMPETAFMATDTPLKSLDVTPSIRTVASNASVVDRHDRRTVTFTGGRQAYKTVTPQVMDPPDSSKFQEWLIGPQVDYCINNKWYIAYPAATVMQGGAHNLAWSERVPQLQTRTSGGPGPAAMRPAPRFKSVQTVPRYSTMPTSYNTTPTQQ